MNPCPHIPPDADREAHHPGLVAAALRVGGRVGERRQPVALVVAEQRAWSGRRRRRPTPATAASDQPAPRHPGDRDDDQRPSRRRPRPSRGRAGAARGRSAAATSTAARSTSRVPGASPRSACAASSAARARHRPTLASSAGCTVNPPTSGIHDREPLTVTPERGQHGEQEEQRPGIHPRRREAHALLADPAHEEREAQPDGGRDEVPHEVGRALGARGGRPHEQGADDRGAARREVEPDVVPGPAAQDGTMLVSSSRHRSTSSAMAARQLLDAVEPQRRADVGGELDHDPLVVEVEVVAVEDVGLDRAAVPGLEGGVGADADRGRHRAVGLVLAEVDAG